MGELRTRKRGTKWEYSFEGAKIEGKRKSISKGGFRTKAEAVEAGTKAMAEYFSAGRTFSPSAISLADYLDYWMENYVKKNLKYNSQRDYESKIRIHIKPALGKYRLSSIEPDIIQKWVDDLKIKKGLSKSMIANSLLCLSGALSYAVYPCQYIKYNPCDYVRMPKVTVSRADQAHTDYICRGEEWEAIRSRFEGTSFYLPLMCGYHLGTRLSESYGFDLLNDVNFDNHEISINHQMQKENKTWFYRDPKYDSFRTIKMGETIEKALRIEIKNRKENILKYGPYYLKTYLMPDNSIAQAPASVQIAQPEIWPISVKENGELMTTDSFKYCARVVHYSLNNPMFHSHCLRHTHGTILAENGVSPKTIMERLGHKNIKTTLETYVFNTEKMQTDAVDIFEQSIKTVNR